MNNKHIERIEGALKRKVSAILYQEKYLERLQKLIDEEKNSYIKDDKIKRYEMESKKLISYKEGLEKFVSVDMIEYFKRHGVDYSMHLIEKISQ